MKIVEIENQLLNLNFNRLLLRRIKISLIHNCCMNILVINLNLMSILQWMNIHNSKTTDKYPSKHAWFLLSGELKFKETDKNPSKH